MPPPTLGSWPARRARSAPHAVATVYDGHRQTYRELHRRVDALSRVLRDEWGVGPGDRVAYLGPNHPAYLETLFAVTDLGAVFVPLNTRLAATELGYMLEDSGAATLLHAESHSEVARELVERLPALRLITVGAGDDAGYEQLIARHRREVDPTMPLAGRTGLDDDAVIMYTSGTTGRPKGARLTHGNLTWNAVNVVIDVDIASDEVTLVSAPLFHTAALGMTTLPTLLKGGTVLLEPAFDPERTIELIEGERVTFAFGVPTMFDAISRSPRWAEADLSSLRYLLCGGAPVPLDLVERYGARGLTFMQGYGMTEAAPHVLLLAAEESRRRAGSAGRPAFFTDVAIDGAGHRGELLVRGPNVIAGYWNGAGAEAFDDGWFHSGDITERDDEGWYRVVDRAKDMFISGGENVYPAEVEGVLLRHPGVDDAAVIGVADAKWGEVGHALIVRAADATVDEQALTAHAGEHLGKYKVPQLVTFVDALPRNPTGKLDKVALRRDHAATRSSRPTAG